MVDFTIPKESTQPAYANQYYTLQTNTGDFTKWVTMFVTGIAIDISDNFAEGNQVTTVKSPTTVNVSQKITNKTLQTKTGYYNGKLVVTLDKALTPTNTKPKLTVYNKEADKTTTITGTWNAKNHTVTFAVDAQGETDINRSKFVNPSRGSYISYSIDCTYEKNSGVEEFKNGSRLSGDLRSQNVATGTTIDDILTKESVGVPIYVLTVKIDKTTVNKAVTQVFNNGTAITGAGGTVNSSSTVSGDYYMTSYELPCNANIVSTPTFNTGCVFSMWTDLNEKTGVSTNFKVTSDYVNDKTYAYERSMPAYNMTLTLTGVLDEAVYTVHHWKQKTTGIASTHDDKNYGLAETETKKAQIGSKVTPAVKTYTGFDSPKTQTKAVTADGKMVIDYYYERHLYNVTLNAGTGIEKTIGGGSYRYGQSVTIDAAVKEGYHWLNWTGNYTGGSGGDQTVDTKKFTFTMPSVDVTMTASAEANKYTIHFDPNGGAGHIDDIETTYDTDVTLPDVWNADGTAAYVKYTLDGQNVTDGVISGAIPKAMMAGYEEEDTESDDTENNDAESEDIESEDAESEDTEIEDAETKDVSKSADDMDESGMEDNSDEAAETEADSDDTDAADETDLNGDAMLEKRTEDDAVDIDALKDAKEADGLDEVEEDKKAEAPKKKVYASIFMGWALEDGKDTFIPKWKAGDIVQNLVAEDGGEITLYAVWDDCPWIQAQDLYYTLEQAQSGFITEEEILSHATATDREDGSPILPGTNPAPSDPEVFTSFTIPDYQAGEFTNLQHDFATSENLTVVDHTGNTYVKQIMVYVTDTTPKKITQMDLTGVTRFINNKYYHKPYEEGGLEDNSIWKVDPEYKAALESALNNMDNDTPVETYVFSKETIKQMKQYVETHGIGNSKEPDALNNFYNQFLAPNKQ